MGKVFGQDTGAAPVPPGSAKPTGKDKGKGKNKGGYEEPVELTQQRVNSDLEDLGWKELEPKDESLAASKASAEACNKRAEQSSENPIEDPSAPKPNVDAHFASSNDMFTELVRKVLRADEMTNRRQVRATMIRSEVRQRRRTRILAKQIDAMQQALQDANFATALPSSNIVIHVKGEEPRELPDDSRHAVFPTLLQYAAGRLDSLLVGPAGSGKSHVAAQVAKALGLRFGTISCSQGLSESALVGRMIPGDGGAFVFQSTAFIQCFEEGGLFLLDEIDAADANLLLAPNQGLANGRLPLPSRTQNPVAVRHPDFVMVAAANTFGQGADRMYVGRNQLDAATLDRFACTIIEMEYDDALEAKLVSQPTLDAFRRIRHNVQEHKLRRAVSTRAMLRADKRRELGHGLQHIVADFLSGWSHDEASKAMQGVVFTDGKKAGA